MPLEITNQLGPLSSVNFRELQFQFGYLELTEALCNRWTTSEDTGLLVYGYVDGEAGLSFHVVKFAKLSDEGIAFRDLPTEALYTIRYEVTKNSRYLPLPRLENTYLDLQPVAQHIQEMYTEKNTDILHLRTLEFLDEFRAPGFPDLLEVFLMYPDQQAEKVWVLANRVTEDQKIYGKLLNEPYENCGIHEGDSILVVPYTLKDDRLVLISVPEK